MTANASKLITIVDDPDDPGSGLPAEATVSWQVLIGTLAQFEAPNAELETRIVRCAKENDVARRLMTVPGIGLFIATAIATLAPASETFRKVHDSAAWLGLAPRQHSTGRKQRLGQQRRWVNGRSDVC